MHDEDTSDRVELPGGDLPEMRRFYQQVRGRPSANDESGASILEDDGLKGGADAEPAERPEPGWGVMVVNDIEAFEATVVAAGGEIVMPITVWAGGRQFIFADPYGNQFTVITPLPGDRALSG